ncbi:Aldehyde dehydrogenase [Mycena indigotica]|uniref:Aldehyde dehydrogenase n=1 Tax=Mycena indigotica TaxID=2126181 RepID=A0A8H6VPF8_9AGAR|nr:Aldehyde dehydrogenase [Mycena indigotica]KAF7289262.1 Aldehyde dehydrogenase [Mycena indigotica]
MMRRGFLISKKAQEPEVTTIKRANSREEPIRLALEKPGSWPTNVLATNSNCVQFISLLKVTKRSSSLSTGGATTPDGPTHIVTTLPPLNNNEPNTQCLLLQGTKQVILSTPGFPKPLPPPPASPAFRLGPSPGKGMGLFSTRQIKQGEIILWERPLLIMASGIPIAFPASFSEAQRAQHALNDLEFYMETAVSRMKPDRRAAFMGLHNCHKKDGSGPLMGRVRTNGISPASQTKTEVDVKMADHSVVSEHISRLNHSCSPNTQPRFDFATFAHQLYAVRDIAEGEELTLQYVDILVNKTERAENLKPYAVVCTCTACTENPRESDKRRSAIASFMPSVPVWAVNRQLSDDWLIKKSLQILEFIEKEKVEHVAMYNNATATVMDAYICLGDRQNASKWAAKVMIRHRWAEEYKRVEEFLDPDSPAYVQHPLWRLRVDENPTNAKGAMYKLMAEACGPGGVSTMSNGMGLFTFAQGQEIPPETLKKVLAMVKQGK